MRDLTLEEENLDKMRKGNGWHVEIDKDTQDLLSSWSRKDLEKFVVAISMENNRLGGIISANNMARLDFQLNNLYMEGLKNQHRHIKEFVKENGELKKRIKELEVKVERYENMTEEESSISRAGRLLQSKWREERKKIRLQKARQEAKRLEKELKDL